MIEITRAELEQKYLNSNNEELARELNISEPTLLKLLRANDISLKGKGYGSKAKVKVTVKQVNRGENNGKEITRHRDLA